jgi:hypothetical protein
MLPERFLTVEPQDLILKGWDTLSDAAARHDRAGRPVNAVSIAFGWPGEDLPEPDTLGHLPPCIETGYFNDDSFPFSQSSREDLLDGYSFDGCTWSGDPVATDNAIGVDGIDDLNGALAALEAQLLGSDEPDEEDLRAGSLGACLLSALLIQAVTQKIEREGLPRPLCVTAGSNGVYPYFDAPVAGMSEEVLKKNAGEEDMVPAGQDVPVPRYSSLLLTGIPRAKKRAVLVLEETDDELAVRLAGLRNLNHPERDEPVVPRETLPETPVAAPEPEVEGPEGEAPDPVPEPVVADGGLLLARKPVKHSSDFRDMLGPRDPDLQQRLQSLIAGHAPVQETTWSEPKVSDEQPEVDWSEGPGWAGEDVAAVAQNEPEVEWFEPSTYMSWQALAWAKFKGWFGRG